MGFNRNTNGCWNKVLLRLSVHALSTELCMFTENDVWTVVNKDGRAAAASCAAAAVIRLPALIASGEKSMASA